MKLETKILPSDLDAIAPDGSEVRVLLRNRNASVSHFTFKPGQCSQAIQHRSVDEIWFILSGSGELWRSTGEESEITRISTGVCINIPVGTAFQIRADGGGALTVIGTTTPPWPAENSESDEAVAVDGVWDVSET